MAIITYSENLSAAGTFVMPADTTIANRHILGIQFADPTGPIDNPIVVSVDNVRGDSATTFTWLGGGVGFVDTNLVETPLVCPSDDLTTFTLDCASAITGTLSIHYKKT